MPSKKITIFLLCVVVVAIFSFALYRIKSFAPSENHSHKELGAPSEVSPTQGGEDSTSTNVSGSPISQQPIEIKRYKFVGKVTGVGATGGYQINVDPHLMTASLPKETGNQVQLLSGTCNITENTTYSFVATFNYQNGLYTCLYAGDVIYD